MSDSQLELDMKSTALVVIDLQKGIAAQNTLPHTAQTVITNCAKLADLFRAKGSPVILVHVSYNKDGSDRVQVPTDAPPFRAGAMPPDWDVIVPELGPKDGDILITKKQWGAFYDTGLDLQLRRRNIKTIVIGGIATNIGVESTARDAFERNYSLVFVEDGMSAMGEGMHEFAITKIFPRLGRVRTTAEVAMAI